MPIVRLTATNVPTLPARDGRRVDYFDALCPGLALRVTPTGARSFAVKVRQGRRTRRVTIGPVTRVSLAKARDRARRIIEQLAEGREPDPLPDSRALTVEKLVDKCLADLELRPSTRHEWDRLVKVEVLPVLGLRAAADVRRADVREWLREIKARSPWTANHALGLLRRVYSWGVAEELLEFSPCVGLPKPHRGGASERVLSAAELWALQRAIRRARRPSYADATLLLLLTGVRCSAVLGMRRGEVEGLDGPRAQWVVPGGPHGRSKSGKPHVVPLSRTAVEIVKRRMEAVATEHLFPACEGGNRSSHRVEAPMTWSSNWTSWLRRRVARALGAIDRSRQRPIQAVPRWRTHDLRHTLRTHLREDLHVSDDTAELILGHVRQGIVGVYNRSQLLAERRDALAAWAAWLESVAPGVAPERSGLRLVRR